MSDVMEQTNRLRVLARDLKKAQGCINAKPTAPEHFVNNAEADARISEIKAEQTAIGVELLEKDKERQLRAVERLDKQAHTGAEAATELLDKLPTFANKVSTAFKILGEDYAEILELSKTVRKTNMVLLGANKHQCIPAAVRIEPNNLHKLLKQAIRASFGVDVANVFLPHESTLKFIDITEAVNQIQAECTPTSETEEVTHEQAK